MKQAVDQKQSQSCKLIFEKNNLLEGIVRSQKIKNLQNNFLRKIKRTATTQAPVELPQFGEWQRDQQANWKGLELPPLLDNCLNLLSVLQIITLLVVYSLSLIFEELRTSNQILNTLQAGSLVFYFLEIVLGLVTVKSAAGKKVELVREIVVFYLHSSLWVDAASLLILVVDLVLDDPAISYLRLFIIFKLPQCLDKIEKL
jgi:nucleoid DNA-binding protein